MDRVFRPIGWERRPCPPPLSSRLPKRNAFQTRYVRSTFLAPFRKNFFLEASNYYCYYCYYYHGRKGKNIYIYIYNWNKGDARREGSVYLRGEFLLTAGVDERTDERANGRTFRLLLSFRSSVSRRSRCARMRARAAKLLENRCPRSLRVCTGNPVQGNARE